MKDSVLERAVSLAFWALSALCLLNLNDLVRMWVGVEGVFVVPMLICCLVALVGLMRVGPKEALGIPGALVLFCLVSYAGVGTVVTTLSGTDLQPHTEWWYLVRHVKSVLVILAAAVGGRVLWRRVGGERVFLGLLMVLTASCALMLASPWLRVIFRFPPSEGAYRLFGSFSDPNYAALVACFTVVTAIALMHSNRFRIVAYGGLLVAVVALVGTFSRTALVVLPVLLFGTLLISSGVQRKRLAGGIAVIGVIVASALANLDSGALDQRQLSRWESVIEAVDPRTTVDVSLTDRAILWSLALEQAAESPLVGNGIGRLHNLDGAWYNGEGVLLGAHNQYLILAGEAGILPLLSFALFLVVMVQAGFGNGRASWPLGAVSGWAIILILFSMTFHGILAQRACNFIIGLSCALMASCSRHESPRPETA